VTKVAHLADRSVRYLETGAGQPIVLLHAFPLSAEQWLPQLTRVPPGCRVVAPDLRGFRGSGPAFEPIGLDGVTVEDYASDVLALMTHLEIARAIVCGLSMGGYVALALMRLAPERVSGLLLANTRAGADSPAGRANRDRLIALVQNEGPAAIAREMLPKLLGATTQREQPDLADAIDRMIRMNASEAIAAALAAMRDRPDSAPQLSSITCPTTIVTGGEDTLIPPDEGAAMHALIPGSRLVTIPNVGHLSNLEGSDLFSTVLASTVPGLEGSDDRGRPVPRTVDPVEN
jgi:pimeloyl-ACP methyl ester carboxylesterase